MRTFLRVVLACALTAVAPLSAGAQSSGGGIFVRVDDVRCLINNRGRYLGLGQNPVLVVFSECRAGDASSQRSVSDQRLPKLRTASGAGATSVLSLRRAELECLADAGVERALLAGARDLNGVRVVEWPNNVCSL